MSANDKDVSQGGKKVFMSRAEELRAAIRQLDWQYRTDAEKATAEMQAERRTLMSDVLQRVGDFGREHQGALVQLRDQREKKRRLIDKEYEEALRRAKGARVSALNALEQSFAEARDEANNRNTENVAPCEAEMRDTEARIAAGLDVRLTTLRQIRDEARTPLADELQVLEQQMQARAARAKAKTDAGDQRLEDENAPGA